MMQPQIIPAGGYAVPSQSARRLSTTVHDHTNVSKAETTLRNKFSTLLATVP